MFLSYNTKIFYLALCYKKRYRSRMKNIYINKKYYKFNKNAPILFIFLRTGIFFFFFFCVKNNEKFLATIYSANSCFAYFVFLEERKKKKKYLKKERKDKNYILYLLIRLHMIII